MSDFIAGVIWFDVALLLGYLATVITSRREKEMTLRLAPRQYPQRDRIELSEWHALERRLAVARLKDELAPRIRRWRIKRALRRYVPWVRW